MKIRKFILAMILLSTIFLISSPHNEIESIRSNSLPIKTNQMVEAPGMFLNKDGAVGAINVFTKYEKLSDIVDKGAELITNIEKQIVYKDRIITNTITLHNNAFDLFKIQVKKERNMFFIMDGICLGLALIGGLLLPNDNQTVFYIGAGVAGTGVLTFGITHLVVRLKRFRRLRF